MSFKYIITPIAAWFLAGGLKFIINFIQFRSQAVSLIGNGGFPSTHTTVISSIVFLIGMCEGLNSPTLGLGVAVLMITLFDAMGIRRALGQHAQLINSYVIDGTDIKPIRERQGHKPIEVLGGLMLGFILAYFMK